MPSELPSLPDTPSFHRAGPCLFATHMHQCAELASLYPNARAWHFGVSTTA